MRSSPSKRRCGPTRPRAPRGRKPRPGRASAEQPSEKNTKHKRAQRGKHQSGREQISGDQEVTSSPRRTRANFRRSTRSSARPTSDEATANTTAAELNAASDQRALRIGWTFPTERDSTHRGSEQEHRHDPHKRDHDTRPVVQNKSRSGGIVASYQVPRASNHQNPSKHAPPCKTGRMHEVRPPCDSAHWNDLCSRHMA